jgi:hypothetical protein
MAKKPSPDPRFDPRFQRGYDGPEPEQPSTPAAPSPMAAVGPGAPTGDALADAVGADAAAPDEYLDAFLTPPRRNPFALALLIGGVAMIAVGGWLLWSVVTASSYPNGYDKGEQAFALIQQQLTPPLLTCGVLGIVGWLVLGALAASARKGD